MNTCSNNFYHDSAEQMLNIVRLLFPALSVSHPAGVLKQSFPPVGHYCSQTFSLNASCFAASGKINLQFVSVNKETFTLEFLMTPASTRVSQGWF